MFPNILARIENLNHKNTKISETSVKAYTQYLKNGCKL